MDRLIISDFIALSLSIGMFSIVPGTAATVAKRVCPVVGPWPLHTDTGDIYLWCNLKRGEDDVDLGRTLSTLVAARAGVSFLLINNNKIRF